MLRVWCVQEGGVINLGWKIGGRGTSYSTSHSTPQQYLYPKSGCFLLQPWLHSKGRGYHLSHGLLQLPCTCSTTSTLALSTQQALWSEDMLLCCSEPHSNFLLRQKSRAFPWPMSLVSGLQLPLQSPPLALFPSFLLLLMIPEHTSLFSPLTFMLLLPCLKCFSTRFIWLFSSFSHLKTWLQYHFLPQLPIQS